MRDLRILPEGIKTQVSRRGLGAPPAPVPSGSRFGSSPISIGLMVLAPPEFTLNASTQTSVLSANQSVSAQLATKV